MSKDTPFLHNTGDGLTITLRVQPRSAKSGFAGVFDNAIRLKIHAPPVDGAANEACRRFLADFFSINLKSVQLVSGATSRTKVFLLKGIGIEEAMKHLNSVL